MDTYPHSFEGPVVRHDIGTMRYTVVFLPDGLVPLQGRVRASGEINDVPFTGAWQPVRGRWFLMLSKTLLRDAEARPGSLVSVRFRLEPDDAVELPEALRDALDRDDTARAEWDGLRPGQQRGLAHRIASAKQPATLTRRVAEVLRLLHQGGPYGPPPRPTRTQERPPP